jgi:hypothetical protein
MPVGNLKALTPNRRQILVAGAAAAVAGVVAAESASATDLYGSGALGDWTILSRSISATATITYVRDHDGVCMFGDSISVQDGKALATKLLSTTGASLAVHNWSGRPTAPAVDALENWAIKYGLPRRILMATGTNDIFNPPVFAAQVDRTMRIVGPNRKVVWVNTQISRTAKSAAIQVADQRNSAWINLQLAEAARRYDNLRIIHWAEHLASSPNRLARYLRDGLHPSIPLGRNARNGLIIEAIKAG